MVGSRCENPTCRRTFPLDVHHIIPRSEGGSNKENNLIVLCKNCHGTAQKGMWSKNLLREWISRPNRFGY
jgi:5-methylcytosine-specific restriction endonuclease McrA